MSLSELYRLAKGKHKSSQQNAAICLAEPHSPPRSDFAELVWENGQVVMQGQLNTARKPISSNIRVEDLSQNSRQRDKGLAKNDNIEMGRLGIMESAANEFHIPVPSELDEHDDMVPWLRYHMDEDEHIQHTYSSDFYAEFPDVTAHNLLKDTHDVTPAEICSDGIRAVKDPHPTPVQNPTSFEQRNVLPFKSKVTQLDDNSSCPNNSMQKLFLGDSAPKHNSSSVYPRMKVQLPTSTIMNFSHFSKHTSVVKSSVDTSSTKGSPEVSVMKQMDRKEIRSVFTGAKPVDPSHVDSKSGQQRDIGYHSNLPVLRTVDGSKLSISKPPEMPVSTKHSALASCHESKITEVPPKPVVPVPNGNTATRNAEKTAEPVVASSVCSVNSADRASNDPTFGSKRKYGEYEDSEYRSEDIEEESVGIRKAATYRVGSGSKRSRAAEVHNLSERRRRDRINEKMRALQELIPNCNKVDKASMLDEAIEYLKTLQLQLQMMSMGPSLCMPPMMLPQAAHIPRFSPMSVGMGMGYGLGMLDMSGNPFNYQLVQMPSVPGTRFPMAPAPGFSNLTAAPFPNQPMYGYQGRGISIPMSCPPATSYAVGSQIRPVMDLNSTSSMLPVVNLNLAQTCQMTDTVQNVRLEETPKSDNHFIQGVITNQVANDVHLVPTTTKVDLPPVKESSQR